MAEDRIIIAGAGQAGVNCSLALRECGHSGSIVLLSDEFYTPYDRPPLSKDLSGAAKPIVALGDLVAKGVDLRLGIGVNAVDRNRREVHLSDGEKN